MTSALQHGNPSHGPTIAVIRLDTGCTIPWHWHSSEEQIMLFKGSGRFQAKDAKPVVLKSGGYAFVPSHVIERFTCTESCTIFLHTSLVSDIHYVDPRGLKISPDRALAAGNVGP
jgi:quercetin dioxygenase-like cupin family protein